MDIYKVHQKKNEYHEKVNFFLVTYLKKLTSYILDFKSFFRFNFDD